MVILYGVVKIAGWAKLAGWAAHSTGLLATRLSGTVVVAVITSAHVDVAVREARLRLLRLRWLLNLNGSNASGWKFSFSPFR